MTFNGLANTRKIRKGAFFRTIPQALKALRRGLVASAANDNGAVTVWKDRDGMWQADRQRFKIPQATFRGKTQRELVAWLKKELPKIL